MRRWQFINLLAAAAIWPFAAGAQPAPPSPACGTIGVEVHPMTTAFAQSLGMTEPYGAIFGRPRPGSAAAKAGIERYDVVTAIEGVLLRSWRDFAPSIARMAPRTVVHLTTWRSRQSTQTRVVVGSASCADSATKFR
jgi:S1-C subfamily serine protease